MRGQWAAHATALIRRVITSVLENRVVLWRSLLCDGFRRCLKQRSTLICRNTIAILIRVTMLQYYLKRSCLSTIDEMKSDGRRGREPIKIDHGCWFAWDTFSLSVVVVNECLSLLLLFLLLLSMRKPSVERTNIYFNRVSETCAGNGESSAEERERKDVLKRERKMFYNAYTQMACKREKKRFAKHTFWSIIHFCSLGLKKQMALSSRSPTINVWSRLIAKALGPFNCLLRQ